LLLFANEHVLFNVAECFPEVRLKEKITSGYADGHVSGFSNFLSSACVCENKFCLLFAWQQHCDFWYNASY
jgi:hypothetical protein